MAEFKPLEHLEEMEQLSALGLSEKQIASKLNIHPDSLRAYRQTYPAVEKAIQNGLNNTIILATQRLGELIAGSDFRAIKFFLEKKAGWGDLVVTASETKPSVNSFALKLISSATSESEIVDKE